MVIKRKNDGTARIYTKTYLNAKIEKDKSKGEYYIDYKKRTKPLSSLGLVENIYSNDNAKKDLAVFQLQDEFDYSKPVELIKRLIRNHYNKKAVILDFFAGSGTTAQAVLELNFEDGGERTFILCTNNQNEICEKITYKRCYDVINSYQFHKEISTILYEKKIGMQNLKKSDILLKEVDVIKDDYKSKYDKIKTEIKEGYIRVLGIHSFGGVQGIPANLKYYKTAYEL